MHWLGFNLQMKQKNAEVTNLEFAVINKNI
jgi:hypothetical protein